MNHWLVKSEPGTYAWADLVKGRRTAWTGVRNYQARLHLRAMQVGDPVWFYHSGAPKEIVGLARVLRSAYPDPTAAHGDWVCVDLAPIKTLPQPVSLAAIKTDRVTRDMVLVKNSRLSVQPVTAPQFEGILRLGGCLPE